MANFFSRFRRQSNQPIFNKANTNRLNGQVRGLVSAIRKLKTSVPSNFQTTNAFINGTKTERNVLNRAIVNFVVKYNKAVDKTNVAAAVVQQAPSKPFPTPAAAVQQARQATQQAQVAAQRMQQQVQQQTRGNSLLRQAAAAPTQRPATSANLEKTVKAPNGRNIVVVRANKNERWNFKNDENKSKYNLRNRNKNEPVVYEVNVNSGNLFKQANEGAVQTPRVLGGFAAPTLPQTAANRAAIMGSLNAANKILALPNENLQVTNVNNLRTNMNRLKNNVRRLRPGFSNEGANTVNKAVKRLASEINRRG